MLERVAGTPHPARFTHARQVDRKQKHNAEWKQPAYVARKLDVPAVARLSVVPRQQTDNHAHKARGCQQWPEHFGVLARPSIKSVLIQIHG